VFFKNFYFLKTAFMTHADSLYRHTEAYQTGAEKRMETIQDFLDFFRKVAEKDRESNFLSEGDMISLNVNLHPSFSGQMARFRQLLTEVWQSEAIAGYEYFLSGPITSSADVFSHKNNVRADCPENESFYRYRVRIFFKNSLQHIQRHGRANVFSVIDRRQK